jgi:hypothetical protein
MSFNQPTRSERRETRRKKQFEQMDKGKKIKLLASLTQRRAEEAARKLGKSTVP